MRVLLLSADLMVASRVEGAAMRFGAAVKSVSSVNSLLASGDLSATLVIVDLSLPSLDLPALVEGVESHGGSGSQIVAFGPHVHEARLAAAREAGCGEVLSRGAFFAQLDGMLVKIAGR